MAGAFAYDGTGGAYGMGAKSTLYGVDDPVQQSESTSRRRNGAALTCPANRFAGLRLEDLQGDMLPLCKDQFGCRYLQKKLEDGNPEHRDMIFNEIFPHFAELMTDPFANYLSQRLLEYSTDEQRDALIESISGELVSISLNMHGTRAVQKMIDYLSTQRQVQSLILALNLNVVTLIKGASIPPLRARADCARPQREPRDPEVPQPPAAGGQPVHLQRRRDALHRGCVSPSSCAAPY